MENKSKNIGQIIEISQKKSKAGRTPIKIALHEIYPTSEQWNANGISWKREYTEQNIESVSGAAIVAQFLDEDFAIPYGSHGDLTVEDGKITFDDSLVVGYFEKAYVQDNIEVNGKIITALVAEGYIYDQRFPELVEYLREQHHSGSHVDTSVEISASKSNGYDKIIYEDGWKEKGRVPMVYEYSASALVIGEVPADKNALMLEINSYKKKEKSKKEDSCDLENSDENKYKSEKDKKDKYNKNRKKEKSEGGKTVEELIKEKDLKIESLNEQIKELSDKVSELNSVKEEQDSKIAELNEVITEVNKTLQTEKEEKETMTQELNTLKEFKETKDHEEKVNEINAYFSNEVSKNGFTEEELTSLKSEYVEKIDLDGLKQAEAELCVKKYKEQVEANKKKEDKEEEVETNSVKDDLFASTKNYEDQEIAVLKSELFGKEV